MTDTPPIDPLAEIVLGLRETQKVVADHHVAILKLQDALTYFQCPEGRTAADVAPDTTAAPTSAPEAPQTLDVGECVEYGLCTCAAGPATTPLKLGQPVP